MNNVILSLVTLSPLLLFAYSCGPSFSAEQRAMDAYISSAKVLLSKDLAEMDTKALEAHRETATRLSPGNIRLFSLTVVGKLSENTYEIDVGYAGMRRILHTTESHFESPGTYTVPAAYVGRERVMLKSGFEESWGSYKEIGQDNYDKLQSYKVALERQVADVDERLSHIYQLLSDKEALERDKEVLDRKRRTPKRIVVTANKTWVLKDGYARRTDLEARYSYGNPAVSIMAKKGDVFSAFDTVDGYYEVKASSYCYIAGKRRPADYVGYIKCIDAAPAGPEFSQATEVLPVSIFSSISSNWG